MMTNQPSRPDASEEQIENLPPAEASPTPETNGNSNPSISPSRPASLGAASPEAPFSPPKRMNKILLVGVFVVIGLLIIGGGAFAYFNYFQSPEKIIQKMIVKLPEIKSFEYAGEANAEVKLGDLPAGESGDFGPAQMLLNKKDSKTSFKYSGSFDMRNTNDPKGRLAFNIKTDALPLAELVLGAEFRVIDKIIYLQISEAPNLGIIDLSAIKNQWMKIDIEAAKKQIGSDKVQEEIAKAQSKQDLTPEQTAKLKTAFEQAKIFEITEKLAGEKIEGVNTYHYKYIINKDEFKKFFINANQIVNGKALTEQELTAFDESFQTMESPGGEIWIGKKDFLPYRITLNSVIKETDKSKTSGKVNYTVSFKNFNQPVQIEVPASVKTPEEVFGGLFGGLLTPKPNIASSSVNQLDINQDTDNDGLTDQEEIIYGTDSNNPDTDGDGFKDGDEVKSGYNPNGEGKLMEIK